jgi:hypothetical protein
MTGREIIDRFAAACAGSWVSSGDGGYLRPGHVPAPVMEIPAGALKANASDRYDPWSRPDDVVNTVIGSYPDPAQAWQITPLPPATDTAWVAADGGVRAAQEDLSFCPYRDQAWRISVRKVRGYRLMGARDFTGPHWLIELEPGDVVTAPDPALPYLATKWWMVQRAVLLAKQEGLTVQLTLNEIDSAIDAAPPALGAAATFTPSSLSRALAVPPVTIGQRVVSGGAGGQYPELTFLIPDTASQASGVVQLQGPATANDNALLAAAQIRNIGLSRGLLHGEPVVLGWYRWRAAGRDVDGSVGAFDASWQAAVQVTAPLVAGDAANLGPQQPNLVPGSAPIYREGVSAAGWLGGEIFGPWRVVSLVDGPFTGAAWQCDVEAPVGYQGVMSPAFQVTAGETLWSSVLMRRVGTWVRGDGGAAIAWFDGADNQIERTQLGLCLDVDNEALSGGWVKLITPSSVVPTGAMTARFENFVEDADGSAGASFQAQAAMLNRGDRLYPWNDLATPSALYGADFQGGITNGGSLVGITAVDNNLVPRLVDIPRVVFNAPWTGAVYEPATAFISPRVTVGPNDLAGGVVTVSSGGGVTVTLNGAASGFTISNPIRDDIVRFVIAFPGRTPISGAVEVRIERDPEPRLGGTGAASAIDPTIEPATSGAFGLVNAGPVIVRSSATGRIIASLFGAFGTVSPSPNGLFARVQYRPVSGGAWVSSGETASLTNASGGYSEYDPDAVFETWSGLGEPVLGFGATIYVPPIDGTIQMIETITGLSALADYEVQLQLRTSLGGTITLPASQFTVEGK